jgi:hypothetical protein
MLSVANKPIMLNVVAPNQLPGGTMGPRYVLQLLFSEKNAKNSTTTEARESADLKYSEFL